MHDGSSGNNAREVYGGPYIDQEVWWCMYIL